LIEEISRIHGYDKIEPALPSKTQYPEILEETETLDKIGQILTGSGFSEIITSSLVGLSLSNAMGIEINENQSVKVSNPQSEDYSELRQNLVPSVINVVKHNFDQGQKNIWVYETGKTFVFTGNYDYKNSGVEEKRILAGAITGDISCGKWHDARNTDFYTLKGVIESLMKELKLENRVEYKPISSVSYLHPKKSAEIKFLGKNPVILGKFGELHPNTQERCKLAQPVYIFEIDCEALLANITYETPRYRPLPAYPAVQRDIAFIMPQNITYQEISKTIKKLSSNIFRSSEIFDVYQGKNIPENSKSVAYRITLQDSESTLTDQKIDAETAKIKEGLKKSYPEITYRE